MKSDLSRKFVFWLSLGLLIRLLLMPFFAHEDLLSIYTKAFWASQHSVFYPGNLGYSSLLLPVFIIKIYSFLGFNLGSFFVSDPNTLLPSLPRLFAHPHISRYIFLLKLPFLVTEFATVAWLLKFVKRHQTKLTLLIFWMLNPFMLYTLYIHGRNEILPIFFIVGFLWFVKKNKPLPASLFLGIAASLRIYPFLIAPLFLPFFKDNVKNLFFGIFNLIWPTALTLLASHLLTLDSKVAMLQEIPLESSFLLSASIPVGFGLKIFLWPSILLILFLWYFFHTRHNFVTFWKASYIVILAVLSLSFFHPQYFSWLAIFAGFSLAFLPKLRKQLIFLFIFQFIGWGLTLLFWGKGTSLGLLTPLNYHLFTTYGAPLNYINRFLPGVNIVSLGRTIIFATHFYLIWLLARTIKTHEAK